MIGSARLAAIVTVELQKKENVRVCHTRRPQGFAGTRGSLEGRLSSYNTAGNMFPYLDRCSYVKEVYIFWWMSLHRQGDDSTI
jgi:hypothetical protein